jgi:hypothetical protein
MALRNNRLVLALALNCLATSVVCVVVLGNVLSLDRMRQSASPDSIETPSRVLPSTAPTYYRDVLPILQQHCVACHRAGGIAPMSFETYEGARRYAYLIRNVTQDKAMPPPFSVPLVGRVTNDPTLTPAQISTLAAWANLKAPAGDPGDAPAAPREAAPWRAKPDLIVKMPQSVAIPASGELEYVYQIVPTRFTEGRWIQMAEVLPSLRANLLQLIVVIRRPGSHWLRHAPAGTPFTSSALTVKEDRRWADDDILIVYSPGSSSQELPLTMGKFIPAGSDLVFRAQYISNGITSSDQSSVGLVFSKQRPSQRIVTLALQGDRRLTIPPNASQYRAEARGVLRRDVVVLGFFPFLHLRGRRFEYDVVHAPNKAGDNLNLETETLLRVTYDLRWQTSYSLSEPRFLKAGTELRAIAWYDNSPNNPNNPNPNSYVNWGDQPDEEELGGFFDVAVPATIDEHKILIGY